MGRRGEPVITVNNWQPNVCLEILCVNKIPLTSQRLVAVGSISSFWNEAFVSLHFISVIILTFRVSIHSERLEEDLFETRLCLVRDSRQ